MSRVFVIFLIPFFLAVSSLADDIQTKNILPTQFNIVAQNFKYLFAEGVNLKNGSTFINPILRLTEPSQAIITRLGRERLRIEFAKPFQFSVYNDRDQKLMAEKAIRSFLVMTRKDQLDKIMQLYPGRYFVVDGSTNEQMQKIVDEARTYGLDHLIREFHRGRIAPRVYKFDSLDFFIDFETLGHPDGGVVEQFSMQIFDYTNIKHLAEMEDDYYGDAALSEIQRFISQDEEPLVEAYLSAIMQMTKRKQRLIERGWLKSVLNSQPGLSVTKTAASATSPAKSTNNVILFPKKLNCQQLFRQ